LRVRGERPRRRTAKRDDKLSPSDMTCHVTTSIVRPHKHRLSIEACLG
jgi:hypothetical protein